MLDRIVPEAARRFGDHPAMLAADGRPVSYQELDRRSDEVAVGLARRGVGAGSVVALTLPSVPEYVVAYVALAKVGAAAAGVNPRLTDAERDVALEVVGPDLVLRTADEVEGLRVADEAPPALPEDPERPVAIVLTSGTTGRPRGAEFRVRQLAAITAADVGDTWGGGGPMLASTQFAHIGFMTKLAWYLRLGTTQLLIDRWRASTVLDQIEAHRVPSVGGVAPQIALLLREPDFDDRDLDCVQTIIVGAAPSPPALVHEARERFGAAYSIRYSSTECGGVGTGTAFDAPDSEALYTVGRPRPPVELSIRDADGRPVPDGEVGEVCLRSPCVMAGYWRDPDATAAALRDGWLFSGDLGYVDDAGCLRLAGRAKEMFIRGGYNVYPLEVEAVLSEHPAVAEVAVVPRPDDVMGEIGVAVVVARDPAAPPTLEDLRAHAEGRLSHHKLPEAVRVVDALPLTPMQKLDRRALAAEEVAGRG
ncbi:MAG TPA: AMP-binding protein [Acidimicrobiales bacterium]|nr:AMP-binding protein [Acidimicrobiales bacterium]